MVNHKMNEMLQNLYKVFSIYEKPDKIDGCSHCHTEENSKELLTKPLKNLEPKDLINFGFSGLLTMGSTSDFKYLLPRIFEIVATSLSDYNINTEIIFSKLRYANWLSWPPNEIKTIRQFLQQLWEDKITNYIDYDDNILNTSELICAISQCEDDLTYYLRYWESLRTNDSYFYMFDFLYDNTDNLMDRINLSNSFWSERETQFNQVLRWLNEFDIYGKVSRIFDLLPEKHLWRIGEVKKVIEKYQKNIK
jgi:hypothetical protein